jgi:hypothetical protein
MGRQGDDGEAADVGMGMVVMGADIDIPVCANHIAVFALSGAG